MKSNSQRCRWEQEDVWDFSDIWNTECGHTFCFTDGGGPCKNWINYCCYCGRKITAVPAKAKVSMNAYQDWLKRPEAERNAEAATVVMRWTRGADFFGYETWQGLPGEGAYIRDWSPCTDRNATDMLLAEVERRGKSGAFIAVLCQESAAVNHTWKENATPNRMLALIRLPASLLTWACVEACREEA